MSLTSLIIKFAAPLPKIESFDRYMFIGPHPDDIEICAGATAAKLASAGKKLCFVVCCDGRFGREFAGDLSPDELAEQREAEGIASAEMLGVTDVHYLRFSDGALYDKDELYLKLAREIGDFKPDVIFAPDPCVIKECHADHLNVGEAARRLAFFAPFPDITEKLGAKAAPVKLLAYYSTDKPNTYVKTSKALLNKQLDSVFKCHLSQFPSENPAGKAIATYLKLRSFDFGLRNFCSNAEGFRALDQTHMHCLPD